MKILTFLFSAFIFQGDNSQPEELGNILEPAPLTFTFETIGWKILAILLFIGAMAVLFRKLKLYHKNKYRREAIKKLKLAEVENISSQGKMIHLSIILKQVAIISFGREQVAGLYGDAWFSFLDSKQKNSDFGKYANTFKNALYNDVEVDNDTLEAISGISKKWINQHA